MGGSNYKLDLEGRIFGLLMDGLGYSLHAGLPLGIPRGRKGWSHQDLLVMGRVEALVPKIVALFNAEIELLQAENSQ